MIVRNKFNHFRRNGIKNEMIYYYRHLMVIKIWNKKQIEISGLTFHTVVKNLKPNLFSNTNWPIIN